MPFALILSVLCGLYLLRFILRTVLPWISSLKDCRDALRDIDGPEPHWFFGNLKQLKPDQKGLRHMADLTKTYPKCMKVWYGPVSVAFSCHHPDLAKTLMSVDIPKAEFVCQYVRPWIGDGLVTSTGPKWKRNRRLLTPSFHFDILKGYVAHHNEAAMNMFKKWECKQTDGSLKVDMFESLSRMSLHNFLRCVFSQTMAGKRESSAYLEAANYLKEITLTRLYLPWRMNDFTFYRTNTGKRYKEALRVVHRFTETSLKKSKSLKHQSSDTDTSKPDLVTTLLEAKDSDGLGLTDGEIRDEVDTFLFAGHDTVTGAMSWAFYNLAKYPEFQKRCRKEVKNVLGGRQEIRWDDLGNLSYLTMFIKESLRLYPPAVNVSRKLREPLTFSRGFGSDQYNLDSSPTPDASRTLPKGSNVQVDIFMLHRNPHVWKEPNKFDPERFLPEMIAKRSPYAFVPFSSGQRNCIGQHFAMNVMKVVLALGLMRYHFTIDKSFPEPEMMVHLTLGSKTGIDLKAKKLGV